MKTVLVMAMLLAVSHPPAQAQSAAELESLKKDIDALKEGQSAIQKDLQEIKSLLRARPGAAAPAQEVLLAVGDAPSKGNKDARLTLVEFTDYQ